MPDPWIAAYVAKARSNHNEALHCLEHGQFRAAISRAYYALYQAANALMKCLGYPPSSHGRQNWRHEEVSNKWPEILEQANNAPGVSVDYDGEDLYDKIQEYRVIVDYKATKEASEREARAIVDDTTRALGWLFGALRKEGY